MLVTRPQAKRSRIGVALCAAGALLGLVSTSPAQDHPPERLPQKTTITGINGANFLLYIVAKDVGIMERYNIEVEETLATVGGVAVMPVIVSGEADVVENGASAAIIARSRGAKVKAVAAGYTAGGDFDTTRFYVRSDSGIKSAKDLEGKRVAVVSIGATPDIGLSVWLGKNGADGSKVQRLAIPYPNQLDALDKGQVDAIGLIDFYYRALEAGPDASKVKLLFRDKEGLPTDKLFLSYTMSDDFIAKNPTVVRAFVAALRETLVWVRKNPEEAQAVVAKHYKVPIEKMAIPAWPDNLCIDAGAGRGWVEALELVGQITKGSLKDPLEWATNEFNPGCPDLRS